VDLVLGMYDSEMTNEQLVVYNSSCKMKNLGGLGRGLEHEEFAGYQ